MTQKKEFSNFYKQVILSTQRHNWPKRRINAAKLPKFEYKNENSTNNAKTNFQVFTCCLDLGKYQ